MTDGGCDVMLATSDGKLIRFPESDVRAMGRTARGVRGVRLGRGARVISLMIASEGLVLTATENGFGMCTPCGGVPASRVGRGRGSSPFERAGETAPWSERSWSSRPTSSC